MPLTLGLNGQRPAGLGLASARAEAGVTRETSASAPVVGVERTQIGSPADLAQRPAPAAAPPAKKRAPGVPQFDENPLAAIGFILQEVAAGMRGTEGPAAKANKLAIQRQSFKMRKDAQMFDAIKFGAQQLKGKSGAEADALIATVETAVPEAAEVLRAMAKAGAEKSQALLEMFTENPGIFPGASDVAQTLGAEKTMELFGPIAAALAEQKVLAPGRVAEAGAIAEIKAGVAAKFREPGAEVEVVQGGTKRAKGLGLPDEGTFEVQTKAGKIVDVNTLVAPKRARTTRKGLGGAVIDIDTGEVVTPGSINVIDQATGSPQTIPIRSAEDLKRLTDRLASGEIVEGRIQRTQEITDIPGAIRILLPDLPADMTPEQARLKGINIDLRPETLEGLLENRGDAQQLDRTFTELQETIAENPAAVGTAGLIARTGNSIIAQLPLIALLAGTEYDPELLVPENYESTFREIGIESQRARSATLGAAYALALAQRRRGGRVAQQDIERALGQIGGTFGQDPAATIQVLQDLKRRTAEGFQTRAASMLGQRPARIEVTPSPAISKRGAMPRLSTQEGVDKLAPGTRFLWVPTEEVGTKE